MINNLFDKKTAEYEFLSVSTELPFHRSDVMLGSDAINNCPADSAAINDVFNHLVDNDLYNEQLILNLKNNRNVPGASITGISDDIINYSQEGQKFILTSNAEPEVMIVKRILTDANSNVQEIEELRGRRINFILDDSEKYIVGTDRGMYCSENRLSGWRLIEGTDYFKDPFEEYDCRCCIRNTAQGMLHNELDKYQYFLGTNAGIFGLENSSYFNDEVYWEKLGDRLAHNPISRVYVNTLKIDANVDRSLFVGTNDGIINIKGLSNEDQIVVEPYSEQFSTNDIEFLTSNVQIKRNEHILVGSDKGIKQSSTRYFPMNVSNEHTFDSDEKITAIGIDGILKYVGTNKNLYDSDYNVISVDGLEEGSLNVSSIDFLHSLGRTFEFAVINGTVYYRCGNEIPNWIIFPQFNSLNNVTAVDVVNDEVLVAAIDSPTDEKQIYYSPLLLDNFYTSYSIDIPDGGGVNVNAVKDHGYSEYIGTENGANIYEFIRSDEYQYEIFKLRNNLQNIPIDKIFSENNHIIAISGNRIYNSLIISKFQNYSGPLEISNATTIRKVKWLGILQKYVAFTDDGVYLVDSNFSSATRATVAESEVDVTSVCPIFHNNETNILFSTSDGKVYFCSRDNFKNNTLIDSTLSLMLEENDLSIKELYSNNDEENEYVDIELENSSNDKVLKQYKITDEDAKNPDDYAASVDLNINSIEIESNISAIESRLSDIDGYDIFSYDTANLQNIAYVTRSNGSSQFNVRVPYSIFYPTFDYGTSVDIFNDVGTYVYSNPFVDINYLRNVLILPTTDHVDIYGTYGNYSIVNYDEYFIYDSDENKIVDNPNAIIEKYASIDNTAIIDIDSSYVLNHSIYDIPGIIAYIKSGNKVEGFKIGYRESALSNFAINKNTYNYDFPPTAENYDDFKEMLLTNKVKNDFEEHKPLNVRYSVPLYDLDLGEYPYNNLYVTDNGWFNLSSNTGYFAGINLSVQNPQLAGNIIYENGTYYMSTSSFIWESPDAINWYHVSEGMYVDFSSPKILPVASEKKVKLIDSIDTEISVDFSTSIASFVVFVDSKKIDNEFVPWNSCYLFSYDFAHVLKLDMSDASNELNGNTPPNDNIVCIAENKSDSNRSVFVCSYNESTNSSTISSLSNVKYSSENEGFETIDPFSLTEIGTVQFKIADITVDDQGNMVLLDSDNEYHLYQYDDESKTIDYLDDLDFDSVVIDDTSGKICMYASKLDNGINSIYIAKSEGFEKIFETASTSKLKSVYTIHDNEVDIFNGRKLFVYENSDTFIVENGIDSKNPIEIDSDFSASKIAAYSYEGFDIVAAYSSSNEGNVLKIYSMSDKVYDNSIVLSSFEDPYDNNELIDITIQKMKVDSNENLYVLALLNNNGNYLMHRARLFVDESSVDSAKIAVDMHPDEFYKYFISSIVLPEFSDSDEGIDSEKLQLNSFAKYYSVNDPEKMSIDTTVYFSTNEGLAYLTCINENPIYHVFKLDLTERNEIELSGNLIDCSSYAFDCTEDLVGRIDKTEMSVAYASISLSSLLGVKGEENTILYGATSEGYALSVNNQVDWSAYVDQPLEGFETGTMDFIQQVPMNAAYVGSQLSDCLFGSNSGLYNQQKYLETKFDQSYRILSSFSIDCIEFIGNEAAFGMHMICLDLEFDFISSSMDDLTRNTFSRTRGISRISDNELILIGNDFMQIYNVNLSETIDLDMYDFKQMVGENIYSMVPFEVQNDFKAYFALNNGILASFSKWNLRRIFGECVKDYRFLSKKIQRGTYVNNIHLLDDKNMFIELNPNSERITHTVHFIKDLRMDIALVNDNGDPISANSKILETVTSDITHGYVPKYMFSSGSILYRTFNKVFSDIEVDKIPSEKTLLTLFAENDGLYLVGTTNGLYATTPKYGLDDEMTKYNVNSVSRMMYDSLKIIVDQHIDAHHNKNNVESEFLSVLNEKMSVEPTEVPKGFTSVSEQTIRDSIELISSDIVVNMEFNDSNKYIRGSVSNWITQLYGGDSTYSDSGYVDQMTDPVTGELIDFSNVSYVCKNWNSGMKEFLVYVPTTMTYYINNPKGFSNSVYSGTQISRRNANGTITSNIISEKCTHYQLIFDNRHFGIRNICMVQIDGNSLPLRMYKDTEYCQPGREGIFDSVIQPSVVNSMPMIPAESVNNVSYMVDSSGFLKINFSIYGTDAQSIRILAI